MWATDGTEAGTVMLRDITPGHGSSPISLMECRGEMLWFTVGTDSDGVRWVSDGTVAGTRRVSESDTHLHMEL